MPELLLEQTRAGDEQARGRLLDLYRNYLRLMARTMIGQPLRVRLDASDLVQETLLQGPSRVRRFLGAPSPS